jgi:hypothetical protein
MACYRVNFKFYLSENTVFINYKDKSVKAVYSNIGSLL